MLRKSVAVLFLLLATTVINSRSAMAAGAGVSNEQVQSLFRSWLELSSISPKSVSCNFQFSNYPMCTFKFEGKVVTIAASPYTDPEGNQCTTLVVMTMDTETNRYEPSAPPGLC